MAPLNHAVGSPILVSKKLDFGDLPRQCFILRVSGMEGCLSQYFEQEKTMNQRTKDKYVKESGNAAN